MTDQHRAHPCDALVKMANEIASNIAPGLSHDEAVTAVADHLNRFWARSMKTQIYDCMNLENVHLQDAVIKALDVLKYRDCHKNQN